MEDKFKNLFDNNFDNSNNSNNLPELYGIEICSLPLNLIHFFYLNCCKLK